jgi:tight adherence protein B
VTAALISVVVGAVTFIALRFGLARLERTQLQRRVSSHIRPQTSVALPAEGEGRVLLGQLEGLYGITERRLGGTRLWSAARRLLERAALPVRTVELFWAVVATGVVLGFVLTALTGSPLGLLWAPLLFAACVWAYLSLRAKRRLRAFDDQFPDLLSDLAASLRAGHSLTQALAGIVEDTAEPAKGEFGRVLGEARLGRPLEDALGDMALRLPSGELNYVMSAIAVQRQVGGSLASLFDVVAETVQERQRFHRKVRALTASGRLSAVVLVLLPFVLAGVLTLMNRTYLVPLFHTSTGRTLVVAALLLTTVGAVLLKRLVTIKGVSA